jgi:hypothetical protein
MFTSAYVSAAAAARGSRREELLRVAERGARRLKRRTSSTFRWRSLMVEASIAAVRGRREQAVAGGDEGKALIEAADAAMRAEGVVDPARIAACLLPGSC